jgi:hypothetical protein
VNLNIWTVVYISILHVWWGNIAIIDHNMFRNQRFRQSHVFYITLKNVWAYYNYISYRYGHVKLSNNNNLNINNGVGLIAKSCVVMTTVGSYTIPLIKYSYVFSPQNINRLHYLMLRNDLWASGNYTDSALTFWLYHYVGCRKHHLTLERVSGVQVPVGQHRWYVL